MEKQLEQLAQLFLKFPGIGRRQATRFAYFILTQPEVYVATLARSLLDARNQAHTCTRCLRIFEGLSVQAGSEGLCDICSNPKRDSLTIIVVEKGQDIDSFDRTDYYGLFFVLNGLIPIVQKSILADTNLAFLKTRVEKDSKTQLEIILAFPLTPNGEHTDTVVREALAPFPIKISSLGRGLSSGAELEYADATSLNASLKKRE